MKKIFCLCLLLHAFYSCTSDVEEDAVNQDFPFLNKADFSKKIVGSAWKNVSEFPIDLNTMTVIGPDVLHRESDGMPEPGVSVSDLYFSENQMFSFFESDAIPAYCFCTTNYVYDEESGSLHFSELRTESNEDLASLFQFKSLRNDSLQIVKFSGYNNAGKIYTLATYVRMPEDKFEEIKSTYTTDYDKWLKENGY